MIYLLLNEFMISKNIILGIIITTISLTMIVVSATPLVQNQAVNVKQIAVEQDLVRK